MRARYSAVLTTAFVTGLLTTLALSACTATTGTRRSASAAELGRIKKLGTEVKTEEAFSVRRARERLTNTGALIGGLVGLSIEAGVRTANDAKVEEALRPALGDFDAARILSDRINAALRAQPAFGNADTAPAETETRRRGGFDAILTVTLKQWGLRVCTTSDPTDDLQAGFNVEGRLLLSDSGSPIWERTEIYLDGQCYSEDAFRTQQGLLTVALSRAADGLARRLVNDLVFP